MFLIFLSLILVYLGLFCLLFLDLASCYLNPAIDFSELVKLVFPFWFTMNAIPYTRVVITCLCQHKTINRDLFLYIFLYSKIYPLFGQILITCVKCSRPSFSPSSYNKKMRWGRGWRKPGMKYFVHRGVWRHSCRIQNSVTS